MKTYTIVAIFALFLTKGCFNLEEEPIVMVRPTVQLSAHIKNARIYATAQINVNPEVLTTGNIMTRFVYNGELAIFNSRTGNIIDINAFSGGGLSQVYTVTADTASHEKLVVIANGTIEAYADTGGDKDPSNDKLISTGGFYQEEVYTLTQMISTEPE